MQLRSMLLVACGILAMLGTATGQAPVTGPAGTITPADDFLDHQRPRPVLPAGQVLVDDMILAQSRRRPLESSAPLGADDQSFFARPWEFGAIPVAFDRDVTSTQQARFFDACRMWEASGVVCLPRTDQPVWVQVRKLADGCYAEVGMGTRGAQPINLEDPGCWTNGIIAHEIGHAFGLIHEHQRPDRDTYIVVNFQNVEEDALDNFDAYVTARLWTPYDFGSLMHYGRRAFAKSDELETITVRTEYASMATNMGQRTRLSDGDLLAMASIYNLPPRVFRTYALVPRRTPIGRDEAVAAMAAINAYYLAPQGLGRPNGLSLGGRPDFLGLAAWFFDVYLNSRLAGLADIEARYNVMASITQSDEWRVKHPGMQPASPYAIGNALPFDRGELLAVLERLDAFYAAPAGLQRPDGLSLDGQPDFLGIAAWVVDVYTGARFAGLGPDQAWQRVVGAIQQTDEWKRKH